MEDTIIRLLLVEDDKVDQMAFVRYVQKNDLPYKYTLAGSIAEAEEILHSTSFDVIILDYWLGDGTSFELFDLFKDQPVIVTTGTGNEEVAVEAMKLGASDYLIKDPDGSYLKTLPATVELALKRKQNEKELQDYHLRLESMVEERTAELQESLNQEKNLTQIIEKSLNEFFLFDAESYRFLFVNEGARENTGYSLVELLEMTPLDIKPDIDAPSFEKIIAPLRSGKQEKVVFEALHRRKDGSTYPVEVHLQKTEYHSRPVFVSLIIDTSQRKKMEQRYQELVEGTSELVTQVDSEGDFLYGNHMTKKIFGVDPQELVGGRNAFEFVHPDDSERTAAWFESCIHRKILQDTLENQQVNQKTGAIHDMLWSNNFHYDEQGALVSVDGISHDITELKHLEAKLAQSQKMESIGTLAGGIAHDFNNILGAIIGYAEFIQQKVPAESSVGKDIGEVLKAGRRAADLVQQILTLSHQSDIKKQLLQPHLIVGEAMKMMHAALPTSISIEENIDPDCGTILADATNIHQIVINLCTNGLHAMADEKGTLHVSLQRRELSAAEISPETPSAPGSFVVLSVSDSGCGMNRAIMSRIFEPYFTTKNVGKGTGLGLSVVHGAAERCGGFIDVESSVGGGATFSVYFPIADGEAAPTAAEQTDRKKTIPTNQRILIVDDELLLVKINETRLASRGYQVVSFTDSQKAFEMFRSQPDSFDLLITDQTMPGFTGAELAKAVLEIKPDMPIIMCTGHSDVISEEKAIALGIKRYVFKPMYGNELLDAVEEVLAENKQ